MPFIKIEMLPGRSQEQKAELVEVFTREICRIAQCAPESVDVQFTEVSGDNWAHAGQFLSQRGK